MLLRRVIPTLLICWSLLTSPVLGCAEATAESPENRAEWSDEMEIETTLFDLYLSDSFQGMILASYTDDWFEIDNPADIIDQIPDLIDGNDLLPLFEGRVPRTRALEELGTVRYNLNTFSIIVEPRERFLQSSSIDLLRRVPDPEKAFSLQQRVGVTSSGNLDEDINTTFSHRTLVSTGKYFGRLDGALVQEDSYELTEALAGGIVSDYEFGLGLLQSQGMQFVPSTQFTGFNIRTAEEIFLDQELIRGSKLEVFIPGRARVEFFRGGRLLSVQILDFGLQEIDTRAFPQGSYDVDIVITEDSGRISRESRFFTKSGFLASRARPLYSLGIGVARDKLTLLDTPVYQAGVRFRATDILELSSSVYGTDDIAFGSLDMSGLYRDFFFSAGTNVSSRGDSGISGSLSGNLLGFNFNSRFSETLKAVRTDNSFTDETPEPESLTEEDELFSVALPSIGRRELLFQDRSNLSGNIYKTIGRLDLRLSAERNRTGEQEARYNIGPSAQFRIIDSPQQSLRFQSSYITRDADTILDNSLLGRYRLSKDWAVDAQLTHRNRSGNNSFTDTDETFVFTRLTYDARRGRSRRGAYLSASNELRTDTRDGQDRTSMINQFRAEYTGDYLQTSGFVRDNRVSGGGNTSIGLNAQSSFLLSGDGGLSVSAPVGSEAVIITEVVSRSTKSKFDILINNQLYDTIRAGEKSIVGVTPYRTYRITVRPAEADDIVDYDATVRQATLFPGNVVKESFSADRVFIALGQLVDSEGNPLSYQRIRGTREYTATESDGSFQMEITGSEDLYVDGREYKCKLELSVDEFPQYFIELGKVLCK